MFAPARFRDRFSLSSDTWHFTVAHVGWLLLNQRAVSAKSHIEFEWSHGKLRVVQVGSHRQMVSWIFRGNADMHVVV
jgi:hypothetical protein